MAIEIFQTLLAGFLASAAWFIIGGALYMNPFVTKIYSDLKNSPGLKRWNDNKKYLAYMYVIGTLVPCLLFSFVYAFVRPALPGSLFLNTLYFGLILVAVKILPRLIDMWLQTTYPKKLLAVEFVNGTIGSFVIALVLVMVV